MNIRLKIRPDRLAGPFTKDGWRPGARKNSPQRAAFWARSRLPRAASRRLFLFSLGVSGAWIGALTRLAPYQPYFIAVTLVCLGSGYWLVRRARQTACAEGAACSRPLPNRVVIIALVVASLLVAAAVALDVLAPLIFT